VTLVTSSFPHRCNSLCSLLGAGDSVLCGLYINNGDQNSAGHHTAPAQADVSDRVHSNFRASILQDPLQVSPATAYPRETTNDPGQANAEASLGLVLTRCRLPVCHTQP
jgi:hypothetical protein